MNPFDRLKDLTAAAFTAETERHLKESFGETEHELDLEVVRTSWTLTYDVPEAYTGARCIQGHIGDSNGPEAEVMFTKEQDAGVQALSRGDTVRIHAWYNHFDNLFGRACFLDSGSDLTPRPETPAPMAPLPEPGPLHSYLANLLAIAYADGALSAGEDAELNQVLTRIGASTRDLDTAFKLVAAGNYQGQLAGTYSEQVANLEDMMRVCMADGDIEDPEQQWITYFAGLIGLDQTQVDKLFQNLNASIRLTTQP